ncbi:SNF2 family domain-containing protein [Colletotrichum caudatum]|nr:SNF2 family domain-containing protein [Colletotrichum caudatum]
MSSTADDRNRSARRRKGPFQDDTESGSDTDMPSRCKTSARANRDQIEELDFFDESIEDSIKAMRNEKRVLDNAGQAACPSQPAKSADIFVENTDGQSDVALPDSDEPKVKSEPDSDSESGIMVIDRADASSNAQEKWSVPRPPIVIDLVTAAVKQEPSVVEGPVLPDWGSESSLEALQSRKKDLESKALKGALTSDDLQEMMRLMSQLSQAAKAPTAITLTDPSPHEQAPDQGSKKREKRKRYAPAADAAEYWARREEKERKRNEKQRERNERNRARRSGVPNTTGKANQGNDSESDDGDLEEKNYLQIDKMLEPFDAIQHRADQGDLPTAPTIEATRTNEQLRQIEDAALDYCDRDILNKQTQEFRQATKAWGARGVGAKNGKWKVRGIRTTLLNHQLLMGAWMMGRELRATPNLPRGGILADAMGLGKTLEALSCIVGNQASETQKLAGKGATLVVCPSGQMISQWMSEVKNHGEKPFTNSIIHFKAGEKMDADTLSGFNIVFATYHQLRASVPSAKDRENMHKMLTDPDEYKTWLEEQTGVLHRIEWHRVVLDEAHYIKNYATHAAFACCELKAKNRWAVKLFSYLKFIRCSQVGDFNDYLQKYDTGTPKARKRRDRLSHQVMTQGDYVLGQPILNLPNTHPTHQYLTLSAEEMVVFRMMERCFRNELNKDMEDGTAVGQIRSYLVMLLRLRQAATHPFLLEGMMRDHFSLKDLQATKKKLKALKGGPNIYSQIGPWTQRQTIRNKRFPKVLEEVERLKQKRLQDARKESLEAMKVRLGEYDEQGKAQTSNSQDTAITGNDAVVINDPDEVDSQDEVEEDEDGMVPTRPRSPSASPEVESDRTVPIAKDEPQLDPFGRSDFGLDFDMTKQIEYLERLKELENAACVVCTAKPPKEPVKGRCGCNFCNRCVMAHLADKSRKCPQCRRIIGALKPLQAFNSDETDEERESHSDIDHESINEKEYTRGFDYNKFQPTEHAAKNKKPNRFLQISDKRPSMPLTPSAKMTALKETVLRWQAEAPEDKIIIFSQFTAVMKIIGRILESEGICFVYLSGKQNTDQRNKAVHEFQNGEEVKVLIASLRAGGQCLNLARGNRVILIELWWNHAVEQQAFARVYRLGQNKETHFVRFIVDTPIESRMLEMQVGKILDIEEALQDEAVRAPKIGLKDIASLLGKVTTRADGVMHIEPDDYDDEYYDNDAPGNEEDESDLDDLVVPDDVVEYEDDEEDEENGVISDEE